MKPLLAFLETAFVLVAVGFLSVLLIGAAGIGYWVATGQADEGDGALTSFRIPLVARSAEPSEPETVVEAVRELEIADRVFLHGRAGEEELRLEGVRAKSFPSVVEVLDANGYQSSTFILKEDKLSALRSRLLGADLSPGLLAAVLTIQAVIFGSAAFLMMRWRVRPGDPTSRSSPARSAALGLGAGLAALLVTFVASTLMMLAGYEVTEQPWVLALVESGPGALMMLSPWIVLVAPVTEELFFRGYVFRFLSQQAGAALAYAASSLMFAAIHLHLPLLGFYLLYGLILAYVYHRTSRILAPIVAHVTINVGGLVSLLLAAQPD